MSLSVEPFEQRGLSCVRLRHPGGATADVSLHGAHVLSWKPAPARERLYLSPNASHAPGSAIRGGIPVIFPQFAARGPLTKHGFARLLEWRFAGLRDATPFGESAVFELDDDEHTRSLWPHRFGARLHVALSADALQVGLEVINRDESPFAFTAALHTYLRVAKLAAVELCGLESTPYEDSARRSAPMPASGAPVRFEGELDRVYANAPRALGLRDGDATLHLDAEGFRDTVVWNPGATLAASMGDLGAGEHLRFVCVEAGTVVDPVTLAPGERWLGVQRLRE
ncbi:D-hexose-6-phosphate mutarotase [Lysobacter auxotrophicus]|uniref:Putative glucose-6-phosphate 1-epimerase n=1 Tax=Lysobacter auxotrophicus TaxID=2992573 RepID=A0ABN6ULI2_9GAMM|nr:D-hexose-6-phosphate mutarotase [Lysobacter auxotrophicus]BDU17146.1 D-hexose-6-phosphate mutarotase [Lysobacter auxotrophicus]